MQPSVIRVGCLLEEMCGDTSRIAATMFFIRAVLFSTATGRYVILHAYQPVGVMMVGNNRYYQHNHADEYQEICNVPFTSHLHFFIAAKIEVNGLITKC